MLYPFQALYCGKALTETSISEDSDASFWWTDKALPLGRRDYFGRWARLDNKLLDLLPFDRNVICFGASETSDLLRAHAPQSWELVRGYMIDRPPGADPRCPSHINGIDIRFTQDYNGDEFECILMGVRPGYQEAISARLQGFGKPIIRWDDLIPEPFV